MSRRMKTEDLTVNQLIERLQELVTYQPELGEVPITDFEDNNLNSIEVRRNGYGDGVAIY